MVKRTRIGALDWRFYCQDDGPLPANLTDGHTVDLAGEHAGRLAAGEPLAACLVITVASSYEQEAVFLVWAECRTEWFLNGQRIEVACL